MCDVVWLAKAQAELARALMDLWRDSPEELEVEDCVLSMDYVWHVLDPRCSEYGIKVDRCPLLDVRHLVLL